MTKDQILGMLPKLTELELQVIHAVSGQLLKGTGGGNGPPSHLSAICFEALSAALNSPVPYVTFAASKWGKSFDSRVAYLGGWFETSLPGWDKNKIGQMALLRMLFELLSEDLLKRKLPTNMGTMVSNLEQIPRIFNKAFPDYLESGMGPFILKKFGM